MAKSFTSSPTAQISLSAMPQLSANRRNGRPFRDVGRHDLDQKAAITRAAQHVRGKSARKLPLEGSLHFEHLRSRAEREDQEHARRRVVEHFGQQAAVLRIEFAGIRPTPNGELLSASTA